MSLWKTFLALAVIVGAAIFGLTMYRSGGAKVPIEEQIEAGKAIAAGAGAGASVVNASAPGSSAAPSGAIALSNDPRRVAAPVLAVEPTKLDPETAKRYEEALDDIEVDACNANGTMAVRVRGERSPHMVRNGQTVKLPHDFDVTLRSRGYPNCRVDLYDGKVAIGEVSGF